MSRLARSKDARSVLHDNGYPSDVPEAPKPSDHPIVEYPRCSRFPTWESKSSSVGTKKFLRYFLVSDYLAEK